MGYKANVATKQAVYSIIYGTDVDSYYKGGDNRGIAIKNEIARLVDIGKNGTQTPNNTDVQVNSIGGFYEDGEYYSQNYGINSPIETSQYTIINSANLPEGTIITDLAGNEKTTFGGTEQFKVRIPKNQLTRNISEIISVKAKCKTYTIFYGRTTIAGTQNYAVTFDSFGDIARRTTLNVKPNTGKIQINKTDAETHNTIEGVTFGLYKKDSTEIARSTTDKKGKATFQNLYQNSYILKELVTNERYILNTKGDMCKQNVYNLNSSVILGYGTPKYQ